MLHDLIDVLAAELPASEPVQRAAWEIVVMTIGGVSAGLAVIAGLWWLLKPRVEEWAEDVIARITRVEYQVTPNGHSTPAERNTSTADRLVKLERLAKVNREDIEAIRDHQQDHEQSGREYVHTVAAVLREQGIEIPELPETE